jgi:hypothetical protein
MEQTETTLAQMYCNATVTFYQCGGHKKAYRNEMLMAQFKEQLEAAGVPVPTYDDALKTGVFNGEGAS